MAFGFEFLAIVGSAAILPHNCIVNRAASGAFPNHCGFALIRNADGREIICVELGLSKGLSRHIENAGPDLLDIMFNPAGSGKMLRKLFLCARNGQKI